MKNLGRGFIVSLVIVIFALVVAVAYIYHLKQSTKEKVSVMVDGPGFVSAYDYPLITTGSKFDPIHYQVWANNTLKIIKNNESIQSMSLDEQGEFALNKDLNKNMPFIVDKDVNYDGYNDVGVLTSTGYAGVNYYYDYYIYNPKTERLEKSSILTQISNPKFDMNSKKIISSYRSGPQWYTEILQWNGSSYVRSKAKSE